MPSSQKTGHEKEYICDFENCQISGQSSDMIVLSAAGFRYRYCSYLHAASHAINLAENFGGLNALRENAYAMELCRRVKSLIKEAFNAIQERRIGPKNA